MDRILIFFTFPPIWKICITEQIQDLVAQWSRAPFVRAYQALRGVSLIVATTVVAEIGDMNRFKNPKQLMAYLGLVPSEHSSGNRIRRGSITKTGNSHVRRALIEAAWTYNLRARKTKPILKRQQGLDDRICEISWKAQLRLCGKYRRLFARGKSKQAITTAIARELSAFIWAIDKQVQQLSAWGSKIILKIMVLQIPFRGATTARRILASAKGMENSRYNRQRQLRDEYKSCGNQPAYISMIHRR